MKVLILNKREFNNYMIYNDINDNNVESQDAMFISINEIYQPYSGWYDDKIGVKSHFKHHHSNVMIMHFPDIGEASVQKYVGMGYGFNIFNKYKARRLYEFIKQNKNKSMAIIHCAAGISRSGAVGTFIYDLYGHDSMTWEEFKRKNPRIQPNSYVLSLLNYERKIDESKKSKS